MAAIHVTLFNFGALGCVILRCDFFISLDIESLINDSLEEKKKK